MIWLVVNSMMGLGALSFTSAALDNASPMRINAVNPLPNNAEIFIMFLSDPPLPG
jgi:hypothetical protein